MTYINWEIFAQKKLLVCGDVMLDNYQMGQTERVSPEAPIPIVLVNAVEQRPGGAANVAANTTALGVNTDLIAYSGDDDRAEQLTNLLKEHRVTTHLIQLPQQQTICKTRIMAQNQQLLRIDYEKPYQSANNKLYETVNKHINKYHAVILSDYAKGTLHQAQQIIKLCKEHKIPVIVDPKQPDWSCYRGAFIITPNQKEFANIVGHLPTTEDEFIATATQLLKTFHIDNILITRGKHGMLLVTNQGQHIKLAAHARDVYDVTGAGDTVIATLACCIAANFSLETAIELANTAAGLAVRKLGTSAIKQTELRRAIQRHANADVGIYSESELMVAVEDARNQNETIVMTNGCFDILHAGHIQYLEQAKKLGKRLIVAINSDDSIKQLKGSERPYNSLENRMRVVAALRSVDWVVPFSSATPQQLIEKISPDILVKGGDYKVKDIAGYQHVTQYGGQVITLPFKNGCSTTQLIEKIQRSTVTATIE